MLKPLFIGTHILSLLLFSLLPLTTQAQPIAARKPQPSPPGYIERMADPQLQQWGDSTVFRAREVQRQFSNLQQSHPQKATGKRMQKILELNRRPLEFKQSYVPGPHIYFVDGVSSNRLSYRLQQLNSP